VRVNTITALTIGTVLWFAAFCVLLVLRLVRGHGAEAAHSEWLWTALAGWLLGLLGISIAWLQHRARTRPR
jgi:hypothetical protein